MKKIIFPLFMVMASGCAVQPQHYDLTTSGAFPPIQSKGNISNVEVSNFVYEPHVRISQNTISHLGCLPCQSDGSTPGIVFASPVNEIIQAEVTSALNEVIIPVDSPACTLGATIHMAAWDVMDGDSIVDMTYTLTKNDQIIFIKRVRGHHNNGLFEGNKIERFLAKASRQSAGLLVTDNGFLSKLQNSCAKT